LQAQALYIRKINEHIEFKQLMTIKHAIEVGQNSIYKAESSITSKLIDSLQLKLSFTIDYNSKVDDDKENLNTETSAVLIYSF
jgi:putative salt-induced outer membrane protein YdiY